MTAVASESSYDMVWAFELDMVPYPLIVVTAPVVGPEVLIELPPPAAPRYLGFLLFSPVIEPSA